MDDKVEVIYIKNGIEKVITFNNYDLLNPKRKLLEVFSKIIKKGKRYEFVIAEDIELIWIKNFVFKTSIEIMGDEKAVLILENCTFKGFTSLCNISSLELLEPKFKNVKVICFTHIDNVLVKLIDDKQKIEMDVEYVKQFNLNSSSSLKKLFLCDVQKSTLKNFFSPLGIRGYKTLGTSNDVFEVIFENSRLDEFYKSSSNGYFKLNLKFINSEIDFGWNEDSFKYYTEKLELINSKIKFKGEITFLYLKELYLTDSLFDSLGGFSAIKFTTLKKLYLKNSSIKVSDNIDLEKLEQIVFDDGEEDVILDTSSYLEANSFNFGNVEINDESTLILDKSYFYNDLSAKRYALTQSLKAYKDKILEENELKLQNFIDENRKKEEIYKKILEKTKIKDL